MAETLTLTTPISITGYSVRMIILDRDAPHIKIKVKDSADLITIHTYSGAIATTLINQLNTANLSTASLEKRILERLVTDGKLPAGTVGGTPD